MSLNFDFGSNWQAFSVARLDDERVRAAQESLHDLLGTDRVAGKSFLDVGCGSGLFAIAAAAQGAGSVRGFDVNATAISTCERNAQRFLPAGAKAPTFQLGSVLDQNFVRTLGKHDVVYAWGSLHHTGAMWQAIRNVAGLVNKDGLLVLALYNAHWTSPFWTRVKKLYNMAPQWGRRVLTAIFGAAMYVGVWVVARRNPLRKERGMDFWYDVVDWLGGYPFEVASPAQVRDFLQPLGFVLEHTTAPRVGTGCNEFVFKRIRENDEREA